jgi:heme-degrading monooxygenase HmoA
MVVQIVRFKSALSDQEVQRTYEARAPQYRALSGLRQKLYLRFKATGEHGAIYVWDDEAAMARFRQSELARTIPEAYKVQGTPDVDVAEVVYTLRPDAQAERAQAR